MSILGWGDRGVVLGNFWKCTKLKPESALSPLDMFVATNKRHLNEIWEGRKKTLPPHPEKARICIKPCLKKSKIL